MFRCAFYFSVYIADKPFSDRSEQAAALATSVPTHTHGFYREVKLPFVPFSGLRVQTADGSAFGPAVAVEWREKANVFMLIVADDAPERLNCTGPDGPGLTKEQILDLYRSLGWSTIRTEEPPDWW